MVQQGIQVLSAADGLTVPLEEPSRQYERSTPWRLSAPALFFVVAVLMVPLLMMARLSLQRYDAVDMYVEAVTPENYVKFFGDPFYRSAMITTLWVAGLTTLLCLAGALPVAYFIARAAAPALKRVLVIIIVMPLLMGNVVRTAGWVIVLDNGGLLNYLITRVTGGGHERFLYTPGAVLLGLTSVLMPYMIVTLHSVLEGIDPALEEASLNLGATHATTFVRIVMPLLAPGILAGCVLCFILSMNAYATPVLLGGPKFLMMAPLVYDQFAQSMNWPFGAALAIVLITATATLTILSGIVFARAAR